MTFIGQPSSTKWGSSPEKAAVWQLYNQLSLYKFSRQKYPTCNAANTERSLSLPRIFLRTNLWVDLWHTPWHSPHNTLGFPDTGEGKAWRVRACQLGSERSHHHLLPFHREQLPDQGHLVEGHERFEHLLSGSRRGVELENLTLFPTKGKGLNLSLYPTKGKGLMKGSMM